MADSERAILESGLASLSIPYSDHQITLLLRYVDLIERWNKAYNLTAVRGRENWLVRHLLDSLAVLPFLRGKRVIDVGTGAGLPGIPLAIMQPTTLFSLLDSNGKKIGFSFKYKRNWRCRTLRLSMLALRPIGRRKPLTWSSAEPLGH